MKKKGKINRIKKKDLIPSMKINKEKEKENNKMLTLQSPGSSAQAPQLQK